MDWVTSYSFDHAPTVDNSVILLGFVSWLFNVLQKLRVDRSAPYFPSEALAVVSHGQPIFLLQNVSENILLV
jgi:hypothetical protein